MRWIGMRKVPILNEVLTHSSLKELEELAQDKSKWKKMVYEVKCGRINYF